MRRAVSITCLVIAWLCANGAPWDALQVVAWGRMFAQYVTGTDAMHALEKTFDVNHPCALCNAVTAAKDTARSQLPRDAALGDGGEKLLFVSDAAPSVLPSARPFAWPHPAADEGGMRDETVPVPPPRA